jgi:hypothetical protein
MIACLREVVMTSLNGKWLWLSMVVFGCGGSQAAAPGASTANEANEATERAGKAAKHATGPTNSVARSGSGSVTATLGPGGGSLELTEGPKITVPAGVIEGGQDFVLKLAPMTTAFANKESEKALGPTFSFSPPLDAQIEVSFPLGSMPDGWGDPSIAYEQQEGADIKGEDSTRTKWQYERAKYSGGRVVATVPQATGMRLQFTLTNLEAQ